VARRCRNRSSVVVRDGCEGTGVVRDLILDRVVRGRWVDENNVRRGDKVRSTVCERRCMTWRRGRRSHMSREQADCQSSCIRRDGETREVLKSGCDGGGTGFGKLLHLGEAKLVDRGNVPSVSQEAEDHLQALSVCAGKGSQRCAVRSDCWQVSG
jgi:hypothetical protein